MRRSGARPNQKFSRNQGGPTVISSLIGLVFPFADCFQECFGSLCGGGVNHFKSPHVRDAAWIVLFDFLFQTRVPPNVSPDSRLGLGSYLWAHLRLKTVFNHLLDTHLAVLL